MTTFDNTGAANLTPVKRTRKQPEKRSFNAVGKFFAKVRIDLGMTSEQWAKEVGLSTGYINNIERGDKELDLHFIRAVSKVLEPEHRLEFADIVASVAGILVIPETATVEQIRTAFITLHTPVKPVQTDTVA